MKVKCIANSGGCLSKRSIDAGNLETTIYPIVVGEDYTVYGISVFSGSVEYLVTEIPIWCPAELFKIVNPVLPALWYFDFKGYDDPYVRELMSGYKEIILNEKYIVDLLEREKYALDIFKKRKKEIDEFERLHCDKDFIL